MYTHLSHSVESVSSPPATPSVNLFSKVANVLHTARPHFENHERLFMLSH